MSESFADLFEESLKTIDMQPGSIVTGVVIDIDSDWVTVHAGLKSEGVIPRSQFLSDAGEFSLNIGDEVQVALESVEDGFGETRLSREKAKRAEAWKELEAAFADEETVTGVINGKVKGGFTVDVNSIRAFLPGSLVDVRPVRDTAHLEGKELEFKVIEDICYVDTQFSLISMKHSFTSYLDNTNPERLSSLFDAVSMCMYACMSADTCMRMHVCMISGCLYVRVFVGLDVCTCDTYTRVRACVHV